MTLDPKVYERAAGLAIVDQPYYAIWDAVIRRKNSPGLYDNHSNAFYCVFPSSFDSQKQAVLALLLMAEMVRTGDVP